MGNKKSNKLFKGLSVILSVVLILSFLTAGTYKDNSVIDEVRAYLKTNYVDELPDSVLNLPTVDDIIKEINKTDPHTVYFTADKYTDFQNSINNTFSGIGVQIEIVPEGVQIITVFDGSPAQGASLKPGDIIMMADSHLLAGLPDDKAVGYIKGPEGTTVKLKVKRGSELLSFDIVRRQINAPTINSKLLDNHIGYIQVVSFGMDTGVKFGEALKTLENKNADSYIVDLRNNGGGYLSTALDIAGYFIGNKVALVTKSRVDGEQKSNAFLHDNLINKPIIFLINNYSASASEILAAAVKDYNKAYFLGVKSYGKGSVQWPVTLSNKDVLKFTIQRFYSPNGNTINKVGISPDMNVPNEIDSMRTAELILDPQNPAKNNNGFVKITANNKTVITKISRIEDPLYWQSYGNLISLAASSGSVALGTNNGWTTLGKDKLKNLASLYFPNYKIQSKLKNVAANSVFNVKFDAKMLKSSINNKNVELIDAATGARQPIVIKAVKDKEASIAAELGLKNGKEYYLVVNPAVKKSDNKALGYGILEEITTIK